MYKSIFIPLSSNGNQSSAINFGAMLAKAFNLRAECTFASKSLIQFSSEQNEQVGDVFEKKGYTASQKLTEKLYKQQLDERAEKVCDWFKANKKKLVGAENLVWKDPLDLWGDSEEQIRRECSFHDLTLVSSDISVSLIDDILSESLFGTGKPLIITRSFKKQMELKALKVVLAWKYTPQTLRALWMAMPILAKIGHVTIVNVSEAGTKAASKDELNRLTAYLKNHGVVAKVHNIKAANNAAESLEKYCLKSGVDLVVMGAYSHSRLKEVVLGGFTRYFVESNKCNIMLVH
jgi:nucleotide-binding universal stress UspA family protein